MATTNLQTKVAPCSPEHKRPRTQQQDIQLDMNHPLNFDEARAMRQLTPVDYYIHDGIRYVVPYYFVHKVSVKKRWRDRKLIDVFSAEFSHKSREYWIDEIKTKRLVVYYRGRKKPLDPDPDIVLLNEYYILHKIHRHESPAVCFWGLTKPSVNQVEDIPIIYEDDHVVVVQKPAGIPVHACGTFRKNSLVYLVALIHRLYDLFVVHRLDACTSGLVILGKNKVMAKKICAEITDKTSVFKVYLARVQGRFPMEGLDQGDGGDGQVGESVVAEAAQAHMPWILQGKRIVCEEKLGYDSGRHVGCCDDENGKEAKTTFSLVAYDESTNTSLVQCIPYTGRSHQIRIHLEHLGFPIANDSTYNKEYREQRASASSLERYKYLTVEDLPANIRERVLSQSKEIACTTCPQLNPMDDFDHTQSAIWLHAAHYEGDGWKYTSKLPDWASVLLNHNDKQ